MRRLLGAGFALKYAVGYVQSLVAKAMTSYNGVYTVLGATITSRVYKIASKSY
jgi:hypothetical protein